MNAEQIERRDFEERMRDLHPYLLGIGRGTKPREEDSIAELVSVRKQIPDAMDELRLEAEWHFTHQKWRGVPWQYFRYCYIQRGSAPRYFGIPDAP